MEHLISAPGGTVVYSGKCWKPASRTPANLIVGRHDRGEQGAGRNGCGYIARRWSKRKARTGAYYPNGRFLCRSSSIPAFLEAALDALARSRCQKRKAHHLMAISVTATSISMSCLRRTGRRTSAHALIPTGRELSSSKRSTVFGGSFSAEHGVGRSKRVPSSSGLTR